MKAAIVIVGARRLRGSRSAGVEVCNRLGLFLWLIFGQRRAIDRVEQRRLFDLTRRHTTWQPAHPPRSDTHRRFSPRQG